jgi:hypothetical protein
MGDTTFLPLRYNKRIVFNWGGIAGSTGICLNRSSTSTSAVFTCVWVLVTVLSTQSGGSNGVLCTAGANCHFKPGPQNPTHSAGPLLSEISLYQPTNQPPLANQRITRVTVSGSEWGDIRIPFFWCSNLVSATSSAVNQCAIRKDSKGLSEQEIGDHLVQGLALLTNASNHDKNLSSRSPRTWVAVRSVSKPVGSRPFGLKLHPPRSRRCSV